MKNSNPGFNRQQNGPKFVSVDEDVKFSEPTLEGVQRERAPDPGTADAGAQQDERLHAVVFAAELAAECQRAHHGN